MCGWQEVQDVLLEVRADQVSTSLRETRVVKLLEKWREPRRNDRIEYHLCTTGRDLFNSLAIVGVIEREVLFADYRTTMSSDNFTYPRVQHVRPNIVSRRQVEALRSRLLHEPGNERLNLLRRHRAGTEDERVTFLSLVLLWVDVELLAICYSRTLDGLPGRAIDAPEDHVYMILLDELRSFGFRDAIGCRTVLKV